MTSQIRASFYRELTKADEQINLAYAALLFSEYLTQACDTTLYLTLLDEMAEKLEGRISAAQTDPDIIQILNHYLFQESKFTGNISNYYHPNNSFLNKVLDLRMGIPISLSVIYLEVGWRLGLPLWGINLPRHFIAGYGSPDDPIYIDVFRHGRFLSEDDCLAVVQDGPADRQQLKQKYLKPTLKTAILYRMLLNLKQIYVGLENWQNAYKVVDLMLAIQPRQADDIRDRGLLAYRLNRLHEATMDLERYLFLAPNNPNAGWLKQHLETMEEKLLRLN